MKFKAVVIYGFSKNIKRVEYLCDSYFCSPSQLFLFNGVNCIFASDTYRTFYVEVIHE